MKHVTAIAIICVWCFYIMPFTADIMGIEGIAYIFYAGATGCIAGVFAARVTKDL